MRVNTHTTQPYLLNDIQKTIVPAFILSVFVSTPECNRACRHCGKWAGPAGAESTRKILSCLGRFLGFRSGTWPGTTRWHGQDRSDLWLKPTRPYRVMPGTRTVVAIVSQFQEGFAIFYSKTPYGDKLAIGEFSVWKIAKYIQPSKWPWRDYFTIFLKRFSPHIYKQLIIQPNSFFIQHRNKLQLS